MSIGYHTILKLRRLEKSLQQIDEGMAEISKLDLFEILKES